MARSGDLVHVEQVVGRHRIRLALEGELEALDLHMVLHQLVGDLSEQHLTGGCVLLEARGDVHRVARGEVLVGVGVEVRHDLAGVDAGAVGDLDAVELLELVVQVGQHLAHAVRRAYRAEGVVLTRADAPEDRHDRVADVLLDLSAVAPDLGSHRREVAGLDLVHRLRVDRPGERRGVLEVGEQQGHRLADLARGQASLRDGRRCGRRRGIGRVVRQGSAAVAAQAELRRVLLAAGRAQDHVHVRRISPETPIAVGAGPNAGPLSSPSYRPEIAPGNDGTLTVSL